MPTIRSTGLGQVVETTYIDARNHVRKTRGDGAGRTLETVDALGNVTTATFDAAGASFLAATPTALAGTPPATPAIGRLPH